ncbi:MAG: hypothetical protein E6K10_02665 [Methanobacteriota archaeon]|nr:MAG: hypothetical protein E6K10_02665 [Euryarchaeota archaeon]
MNEGYLKPRGPMGWRSTSTNHAPAWEEANSSYVPPLVYAVVANRGSVLGSLKKILSKAENE